MPVAVISKSSKMPGNYLSEYRTHTANVYKFGRNGAK